MNQAWRAYPNFHGPRHPAIPESVEMSNKLALECGWIDSPMLSRSDTDSVQSHSPSVSSKLSYLPSGKPPVVQTDDDDDPIAEAMAAVGLDPGLIDEIKGQAKKRTICSTDPNNQYFASCPTDSTDSAIDPRNQLIVPTKSNKWCPVCHSSYSHSNLKKHLFNHMVHVIVGMERANRNLVLWIKETYPVVLERTVYCQLCKSNIGDFTILDMRFHVGKTHWKDNFCNFKQTFESCFPKWSEQELVQFGFCERHHYNAGLEESAVEVFCPVCSDISVRPEETSEIIKHANHMGQHLQNLIAGKERPNPRLTLWLKRHAPLSLERNIFCRICQSAYFPEHSKQHGKQGIDFCFPKWTSEELLRLGFIDKTQIHSSEISEPRSNIQSCIVKGYIFSFRLTNDCNMSLRSSDKKTPFHLPRSDFDIVDTSPQLQKSDFNLLDKVQKFDIEDDQQSTPSPGRLVIDLPDESYSPALAMEEIVDDDDSSGVGKAVATKDSSLHIDNDEDSYGVDKTVDTSLIIAHEADICNVDNTNDTVLTCRNIDNTGDSHGVDKLIDSNDTSMLVDVDEDSCNVDNSADIVDSIAPNSLVDFTENDIVDDISVDDTEESMDISETLYPSSPGFVPIDSSPIQESTSLSSYTEQSSFSIVELSPASAYFAVHNTINSDHELFDIVFPSDADKIEAAMADLAFWNKDYYGFFCQLVKFPTFQKQDQHIVRFQNE